MGNSNRTSAKIIYKKNMNNGTFNFGNSKTRENDFTLLGGTDLKATEIFSLEGQAYDCSVYLGDPRDVAEKKIKSDVYDGDTLYVVIIHMGIPRKVKIRLLHIDTPEMKPRWKQFIKDESDELVMTEMSEELHKLEKKKAIQSRNALKEYIWHKNMIVKFGKEDSFGRVLSELFIVDDPTNLDSGVYDVGKWMLKNRYAIEYEGGKKIGFDPQNFQ